MTSRRLFPLLAAGALAAAGCVPAREFARPTNAGPPVIVTAPRYRRDALPRTLVSEFDPIGVLLELRDDLSLSEGQVRMLRTRRWALRTANRPRLARLDSLNDALGGKLDGWLETARGAEPSFLSLQVRLSLPKLPAVADALTRRVLACIRSDSRDAARDAIDRLSDAQLTALDRLHRKNQAVASLHAAVSGDGYVTSSTGVVVACTE